MTVENVAHERQDLSSSENEAHSVYVLTVCGFEDPKRNLVCDQEFLVLCGEGVMMVAGRRHELYAGVEVSVPHGADYHIRGETTCHISSEPPFYEEQVEAAESQFNW